MTLPFFRTRSREEAAEVILAATRAGVSCGSYDHAADYKASTPIRTLITVYSRDWPQTGNVSRFARLAGDPAKGDMRKVVPLYQWRPAQ